MLDIIYRYDPANPVQREAPADARAARKQLEDGNQLFARMPNADLAKKKKVSWVIPIRLQDLGLADAAGTAPRQEPYAIVLGCSDARVPTELIFQQGCNDLFVVRVVGNVLGSEGLGSIDYAMQHFHASLRVIVVLGHSSCGAVTAAVDAFLRPASYPIGTAHHPIRSILDKIFIPVRVAAGFLEKTHGKEVTQTSGYRQALVETSIVVNAALTAMNLQEDLRQTSAKDLQVVYSVYDLISREIGLTLDSAGRLRLADPPGSVEDFIRLGAQLTGGPLVRQLLGMS